GGPAPSAGSAPWRAPAPRRRRRAPGCRRAPPAAEVTPGPEAAAARRAQAFAALGIAGSDHEGFDEELGRLGAAAPWEADAPAEAQHRRAPPSPSMPLLRRRARTLPTRWRPGPGGRPSQPTSAASP
ncbi:unnamed protein product, partial [Prorocentrum cordatum]